MNGWDGINKHAHTVSGLSCNLFMLAGCIQHFPLAYYFILSV